MFKSGNSCLLTTFSPTSGFISPLPPPPPFFGGVSLHFCIVALPLKSPVEQHEAPVLTEVTEVKVHSDCNGTGM